MSSAAVFLDRDGVLIDDVHLLTRPSQVRLAPGAAECVRSLRERGFLVVVVTNQAVVGRGLASESDVREVHHHIQGLLRDDAGELGTISDFRFCPHHPQADVAEYRVDCECRKPRPGMILDAARDLDIDPGRSFLVGDRLTDIAAGREAGCTTVLVETGRHGDAPIETSEPVDPEMHPDHTTDGLVAATEWIVED
jgi:D-glycero-D-manno-heptose 1,7-bisphosphate phosphatase